MLVSAFLRYNWQIKIVYTHIVQHDVLILVGIHCEMIATIEVINIFIIFPDHFIFCGENT